MHLLHGHGPYISWLRFMLCKTKRELRQVKDERTRLIHAAWKAGMTDREIGELLGISKSRVGRIRNPK